MEMGSYVWFVGLAVGIVALGLMFAYGRGKGRPSGGDPNHAWKQAAAESGHPEVARPPDPPRT